MVVCGGVAGMKEVGKITMVFGEENEANIFIAGEMSIKSASILMGKTIGVMLSHLGGINTTTPTVETVCEYFNLAVVDAIKEASK